jgi:hypothetical protein
MRHFTNSSTYLQLLCSWTRTAEANPENLRALKTELTEKVTVSIIYSEKASIPLS